MWAVGSEPDRPAQHAALPHPASIAGQPEVMRQARRNPPDPPAPPPPATRKAIFKSGYDQAYGARPLKRAIQRLVQAPLAIKILDGSVRDHVLVDATKSGLAFAVTP